MIIKILFNKNIIKKKMKFLNYGSLNIDKIYEVEHFVRAKETCASLSYYELPGGKGLKNIYK